MDTNNTPPVACTLTTKEAASQVHEWADLQGQAQTIEAIPGGVRMTMPAALEDDIKDLAAREGACCAFLEISLSTIGDAVQLEVTSQNPQALPVISLLSGVELA